MKNILEQLRQGELDTELAEIRDTYERMQNSRFWALPSEKKLADKRQRVLDAIKELGAALEDLPALADPSDGFRQLRDAVAAAPTRGIVIKGVRGFNKIGFAKKALIRHLARLYSDRAKKSPTYTRRGAPPASPFKKIETIGGDFPKFVLAAANKMEIPTAGLVSLAKNMRDAKQI